jgi:hypothetical protein
MMDMPRFDMARLLVRRAGFDFWSLVGAQEDAAEAAGRRSFQVLINLGSAEGAAAVELLRGWGYACSGLLPGYLEGGQHAAIMYRNFEAPHFEGIRLHDDGAKRMLSHISNDWQRAERLGNVLRDLETGELNGDLPAEHLPAAAAPDLPSLDKAREMLGIDGRVNLTNGGMVPVGLDGDEEASVADDEFPLEEPRVAGGGLRQGGSD